MSLGLCLIPKWDALRCQNKHFALYVLQFQRFRWIMKFDKNGSRKVIQFFFGAAPNLPLWVLEEKKKARKQDRKPEQKGREREVNILSTGGALNALTQWVGRLHLAVIKQIISKTLDRQKW